MHCSAWNSLASCGKYFCNFICLLIKFCCGCCCFYTHKKGNTLRKNPMPISMFTFYSLKTKFVPFLKRGPATIPCKKDDKVGQKLLIKEKGKEKKRAREKDRNRFANKSLNFGLSACVKNKKTA